MTTNITESYFYEVIEDYKEAVPEEQDAIFRTFCTALWANSNTRRIYTKAISFQVRKDLLHTELGQVFDAWSEVTYHSYKSLSKETDYMSLLRQKINNLYTRYFDKKVILQSDYLDLLKTPKRLYLSWLEGTEMSAEEATIAIDDAIAASVKCKEWYQKQKIDLSWADYQLIIEDILRKAFDHAKYAEEYEASPDTALCYEFLAEDNLYIKYFCHYLECELKQWQYRHYGVRAHQPMMRCQVCGGLTEKKGRNQKYCKACLCNRRREINHNYYSKTVLKSS